MKFYLTLALAVVLGFLPSITFAQAPATLSFLTSKAALRAYAVEQATNASIQVYAESQVSTQPVMTTTAFPTKHTSQDILSFFNGSSPSITIVNPMDTVYTWASVVNADGDQYFYASAQSLPVATNNIYSLSPVTLTLVLDDWIAVSFGKSVSSATLLYVDPNSGQTTGSQYLSSYINKIYFPTASAGNGYLVVNFTDGTSVNYDLRTGTQVPNISLAQKVSSSSIDGLIYFTDPLNIVDIGISSVNGIGENHTYEVSISHSALLGDDVLRTPIPVFAATTEGAVAVGFWVRLQGNTSWQFSSANVQANIPGFTFAQGTMMAQIPFHAGTYYIVPVWNPTDFAEPTPVAPGGGKG